MLEEINEEELEDSEELKNVKIKAEANFGKDTFGLKLSLSSTFKDTVNFDIQAMTKIVKDDSINVAIPENVKMLTDEDFSDSGIKEDEKTKIEYNISFKEKKLDFQKNKPLYKNGAAYIPLEDFLEKVDGDYDWYKTNEIDAEFDGKEIEFKIGRKK